MGILLPQLRCGNDNMHLEVIMFERYYGQAPQLIEAAGKSGTGNWPLPAFNGRFNGIRFPGIWQIK